MSGQPLPLVGLDGPEVFVSARRARLVAGAVRQALRRDGSVLPEDVRVMLEALDKAAEWWSRVAAARMAAALDDSSGGSARGSEGVPSCDPAGVAPVVTMSTAEAAKRLGCSPRRVVALVHEGKLGGFLDERGHWRVHEADVEARAAVIASANPIEEDAA